MYIGIDIGSVGTKIVILDEQKKVVYKDRVSTSAEPVAALKKCFQNIVEKKIALAEVKGVGVTGSAREVAAMILKADVAKNEISCHAKAASFFMPDVATVIEIGGQDSKLILFKNGKVNDFAMNSVCAAGTGSFIEQQASRIGIDLDTFSKLALSADKQVAIAARCTVFAESDMIYKQQVGHARSDILYGLCVSLAKNYLNTLAKGKELKQPVVFQGGVASNKAMHKAFEEVLGFSVSVPQDNIYMGAIGAAIYASLETTQTTFTLDNINQSLSIDFFTCEDCDNRCEVLRYSLPSSVIGYKGDNCGKYSLA